MRFSSLIAAIVLLVIHATGAALAAPTTLVAIGDSLTAGYGLDPANAFPVKLEAALRARGHDVSVVNAGVSGDTTSGGLARLDWSLGEEADAVLLELGANDALRGLDPSTTRKNMAAILDKLQRRGLPVLVAGMLAPPNLGPEYATAFDSIFPELAKSHGFALYPFFLDGVAANPALNQGDGMHPNAKGVDEVVKRILPAVEALLARAGTAKPTPSPASAR